MIPGGGQFKANRGAKGRNCSKLLELDTATHIWGWIYSQHLELDKSAVSTDGTAAWSTNSTAVPTDGTTMSTDNTALVSTDRIKKGEFYKEEAAPSTSNKPEMTRAERREIFKKLNILNLKSKKGLGKKDLSALHMEESWRP
ncbi:hypothetical protein FIBSPDRAFT_1036409 [Athelia psychrophila]|uniref:Uncharacterized protein n=1 Tax=Athelia psychrophila TaxID=1759441 RepID=A0A166W2F1_9AGAM|nr:hypothetical protein FIBSPDRAFT_1036409 [Fibularhizoctonia sp. CBS 109695]